MQLRIAFAAAVYLGSYLPLSLILLVQDVDAAAAQRGLCPLRAMIALNCTSPLKNPAWALSGVVVCALGLAATLVALRRLPPGNRITVTEIKHVPADLINYVIPYVVSFMSLDYEQGPKLVGFAVFLLWIFWITYKSGQIAMNPVLTVLGWKLYEIKYTFIPAQQTHVGRALSKDAIKPGKVYRQSAVQDVMIARGDDEGYAK